MNRLVTHSSPDPDAYLGLAVAKLIRFKGVKVEIFFVNANDPLDGLDEGDVAVDIEAGGRGFKGIRSGDGKTVHSAFAQIVERFATPEDQEALAPFVAYVDACDTYGSAIDRLAPDLSPDIREVINEGSVLASVREWQHRFGHNIRGNLLVLEKVEELLLDKLEAGRRRLHAERQADKQVILDGGRVAVVINAPSANDVLFRRGVRAIVWKDGKSMGVSRERREKFRVNHPELQAFVTGIDGVPWFDEREYLLSWGTKKARPDTHSKVDPEELARRVDKLIVQHDAAVELRPPHG